MSSPAEQQGFSLVELLVALAIFGLAATALIRLQATMLASTLTLEARQWAAVVAHNQAVAAQLSGQCGAGQEAAGGRDWRWQCRRSTGPAGLVVESITVAGDDGQELAMTRRVLPP